MSKKLPPSLDSQLSVILSHQDQEVAGLKKWMTGGLPDAWNPQLIQLYNQCLTTHENEMLEVITRFALVGIRQVFQSIMEDRKSK
jgi:hypothetical protein